ncbi:MAG TPA: hypothetical protein ENJ91_11615 [Rhodobacteraceae bacterium]|nr:hypothetical protein [Paracoccaceae bacterium]
MKKIAFVLAVLAAPVFADVVGPGGKVIDCYCTDQNGDRVELGQTICLEVNGRRFTARCEMSLNNPMWREQQEGCVSSGLIQRFERIQPATDTGSIHPKI